jgi:signal transduction histidine kinase
MASTPNSHSVAGSNPLWVPGLVLLASFSLTLFATYYAHRSARLQSRQEFETAVYHAHAAVQNRMDSYLALLRGGTAFYAADPNITREDFHKYVERLRLAEYYPGIQGFGFSAAVRAHEMDTMIARARGEGLTNFHIWPTVTNQDIHTIYYIEPMDRRNLAALGYNMYSEPIRRAAMQQACDMASPVATAHVTLVQEIEGPVQPGFLIYAPVYQGGIIPSTIEERRERLLGFIYSPFRANDLFENVLPANLVRSLTIQIYDGNEPSNSAVLYRSPGTGREEPGGFMNPLRVTTMSVVVAEHTWTMRFVSQGEKPPGWFLVPLIFFIGTLVTLLLCILTVSQSRARARLELANERLRFSEQSLREARGRLEEHARELEERVAERTARLQETVKDLEAVLYHVAHDLRAPVRAMGSFASILTDDYRDKLDPRAMGYLGRISAAASRMDRLVYDLLSYGRLAQMVVPLETVSLDRCVSTALSRMSDDLRSRSAEVKTGASFPEVCANTALLTDIITRLLGNAIKFVPADRRPSIHVWAQDGPMVRVWVEDNGIGIGREYHERIFRVFERLHSGDAYPGTGIGLAIARKAIERMGGRIGLESTPGHGSRFWIELERSKPADK